MHEDFEDQLRDALRRRDPSAGFAERVIARANPPKPVWSAKRVSALAAIAAVLVMGVFVNQEYQQRRAEDAHRKAMLALSITAKKLNLVREIMYNQQTRMETETETENQ